MNQIKIVTEPLIGADNDSISNGNDLIGRLLILENQLELLKESSDVFFLITIAIIIFFMQAGFAFLEVGAVRSKNATNILIKNMLDVFIGGLSFWLVGYPLAFGEGNGFMGTTYWASANLPDIKLAHWFFQFVFAATAATIVSGSVAERCAFNAYLIYSIVLTAFVYPLVAHWAWSDDGWLAAGKYQDFAGGGVVHLTGGISALVAAIFLGPRIGRFDQGNVIRGHSVPLAGLGGFILLFGFLAFNGGSQGSISQPGDAAAVSRAVVVTVIAGCSGGVSVLVLYRVGLYKTTNTWSFLMTLNGALTGMVSICSGCNVLRPWGALVIGAIGGFLFLSVHYFMIKMKVDDPLDAVAVHLGGGIWSLTSVALFMDDGLFHGQFSAFEVLAWNIAGLIAIIGWAGGICCIMFGILSFFGFLRVPPEMEMKGLDILKHGEPAYPAPAWIEEQYMKNLHIPLNMADSMPRDGHCEVPTYWTLPDQRRSASMYAPNTAYWPSNAHVSNDVSNTVQKEAVNNTSKNKCKQKFKLPFVKKYPAKTDFEMSSPKCYINEAMNNDN